MTYDKRLYELKDTLYKYKFENELKYLESNKEEFDSENLKNGIDYEEKEFKYNERIDNLKKLINEVNIENKKRTDKGKINFDEIDNYVYKKPWKKLADFHKIEKLKEFSINSLNSTKNQKKFLSELLKLFKDKKLNKKDIISYDVKECKITSINGVSIDEDKKTYKIEF